MGLDPGTAIIHRACEMHETFYTVGNQTQQTAFAQFVRNPRAPIIRDANTVGRITCATAADLEHLFAEVETAFADAPHRAFGVTPLTSPVVAAHLELADYQRHATLYLLLEDDLKASPSAHDIREIDTEAAWAEWAALDEMNFREKCGKDGLPYPPTLASEFAIVKRARTPAFRYWGLYVEDVMRAYFSSWPGVEGIGLVEDLFTHPEYRHRGLATALIVHAVADTRARGARECAVPTAPDDTPKHLYAALGFRPLMTTMQYFRDVADGAGTAGRPRAAGS